jgi:SAM-dependent methyltransferase
MAEASGAERASSPAPVARRRLESTEAAVFETFVVPRYLSLFGELALEMIAECQDAQVVHLNCRTGYPDYEIVTRLRGAYVVGVDDSDAALALARAKALTVPEMVSQYHLSDAFPTPLPAAAFSHALELHSLGDASDRARVIGECKRLLAVHGQAIIAMPMRGSFQELSDLLREYALKYDDAGIGRAAERAATARPTVEILGAELEKARFDFVDVSLRPTVIPFRSARDFFEDPISRLLILPELRSELGVEHADAPLSYVREAIDKYWSDGSFELTVNVGCVTGRLQP